MEFLRMAELGLSEDLDEAAALNAVHAVVAALDAFCGQLLGRRSASLEHRDSFSLALEAGVPDSVSPLEQALSVLSMKNRVSYEAVTVGPEQAAILVKRARRFVDWVEQQIGDR